MKFRSLAFSLVLLVCLAAVPQFAFAATRDTISVKDFGAVGNGVEDDTYAIRNALYAADATEGVVTVKVPKGTYIISDVLFIFSDTHLLLEDGAVIKGGLPGGNMLKSAHHTSGGAGSATNIDICADSSCKHGGHSQASNITIEGGTWDRNSDSSGPTYCFALTHGNNITLKNIVIKNCMDHMVDLTASSNVTIDACEFRDAVSCTDAQSDFWQVPGGARYDMNDSASNIARHKFAEAVHLDFANSGSDSYPQDNTACENITISNCKFIGVHAGLGTHHDNSVKASNIAVSNCTFTDILGSAIDAQCFTGMTVSGCTANAVERFILAKKSDAVLTDNTLNASAFNVSHNVAVQSFANVLDGSTLTIDGTTEVNNPSEYGAFVSGANLTVKGAFKINKPGKFGIRAADGSTVNASDVTVASPGDQGVSVSGSKLSLSGSSVTDVANGYGFYAESNAVATVSGSIFSNCKVGIAFSGSGAGSAAKGNTISNAKSNGLQVTGSTGTLSIQDNTINGTGGSGMYLENTKSDLMTISGNKISSLAKGGSAIRLKGGNASIASNNLSSLPVDGFGIFADAKAKVDVRDNTIVGSGNAPSMGIYLDGCADGAIVKGNKVSKTSSNGIRIAKSTKSTVESNTVESVGNIGIYISDGNNATVRSNTSSKNGSHGIIVENGTGVVVEKNTLGSNKGAGINIKACPAVKVVGNNVQESTDHGIFLRGSSGSTVKDNTSVSHINIGSKREILLADKSDKGTVTGNTYGPRGLVFDETSAPTTQSGNKEAGSTPAPVTKQAWERVAGNSQYDTMQQVVKTGWTAADTKTVILATGENFPDALSAAGVAGLEDAPVIITKSSTGSLSDQAREEIARLKPDKILVVGGIFAMPEEIVAQATSAAGGAEAIRLAGNGAPDTAAEMNKAYADKWGDTAFLATSLAFPDALSAAPIAYAQHIPIFLVDHWDRVSQTTYDSMKACGIKNVIVLGGMYCVSDVAKADLRNHGYTVSTTLAGNSQYDTSKAIADWGLANGMSADKMGVACGLSYPDALTGAALCGQNSSVMVLADSKDSTTCLPVVSNNKDDISFGYVFGGIFAVPSEVMEVYEGASK